MRRRSWWIFQAAGVLVLLLAGPRALHGLREDIAGPYGLEATSQAVGAWEATPAAVDRTAELAVDTPPPVSNP